MRSGNLLLLTSAFVFGVSTPALAMSEAQRNSIEALGDLNGIALACRYSDETKRVKLALIDNLPKLREYGALFQDQTNLSYLDFVKLKTRCPEKAEFSTKVDTAIAGLESTFKSR